MRDSALREHLSSAEFLQPVGVLDALQWAQLGQESKQGRLQPLFRIMRTIGPGGEVSRATSLHVACDTGMRSPSLDGGRVLGIGGDQWCAMRSRLTTLTGSALVAGMLAGCSLVNGIERKIRGEEVVVSTPAAPESFPRRPKPMATSAKKPSLPPRSGERPDSARNNDGEKPNDEKEEAGVQDGNAPKLVGMDQEEITRVLGPPMAETERAPGKVWRYWNARCMVDVSMYLDVHSRSYRVLAYEVTNHDYSTGGRSACLAGFPKRDLRPASYDGL